MVAANPDPAYMASLAALDDADAGAAIATYATGAIANANNQIANLQSSITLTNTSIASLQALITSLTLPS